MSGIKERLSRLKRSGSSSSEETNADANGSIITDIPSSTVDHSSPSQPDLHPGWVKLGVQVMLNTHGSFLIRERRFTQEYAHGLHRVGELSGQMSFFRSMNGAGSTKSNGTETEAVLESEQLLFLDTETTGLGLGAGNVAFMIGIGYYEANEFVVQQLFIRNPAEELAMLVYLQNLMETRNQMVTYNGKSFDWPIIKNRFVMNRLRPSGDEPQHFDLLYPSRSLWRRSLPSCRLSMVEKARLGLSRIDDVPGSLAPELYFLYLAEGNPTVLSGVFEHNEKDVLTLAALSVHFSKLLEGIIPLEELDDEELYRFAIWMDKIGEEHRADEAIGMLIRRPAVMDSEHAALCAAFYKRRHSYELAVPIWRHLALHQQGRSGLSSIESCLELAMYYEHREKNISEALKMAEHAQNRLRNRMALTRNDQKHRAELEQIQLRIARLRKKLVRSETNSPNANRALAIQSSVSSKISSEDNTFRRKRRMKGKSPSYAMESLL